MPQTQFMATDQPERNVCGARGGAVKGGRNEAPSCTGQGGGVGGLASTVDKRVLAARPNVRSDAFGR